MMAARIKSLSNEFQALGHPRRLEIMLILSRNNCDGGACVNFLHHELNASQPLTSQYLRCLKQAGLVRGRREGHNIVYSLTAAGRSVFNRALQVYLERG